MARLTMYTATCWREGTSWTVHIGQLDRTTWAARLSDVDAAARRLIAGATDTDPDGVEVLVDLRVPDGITRLLDAAAAARQESDVVSVEAIALRRSLARQLTDHGYGVRDIAVLLGVSYARAKQLAGDPLDSPVRSHRLIDQVGQVDQADYSAPAVVRPHRGYQHEAFLYRNDDEFLTGTVSFIEDAVTLGQPVMVALVKSRMQMLQAALEPHDGEVEFVDMGDVGANPARIVPAWLDFIQRNAGRPIRGISEPQWPGRRPEEVVECQLHDGLLNVAIDPDIPLWLRCPYDAAQLPAPIARAALDSHPALVEVSSNRRSTSYRGSTSYGGLHHVDSIFRSELPPAPSNCVVIRFGESDLGVVREHATRMARGAGLGRERSRSLTHAISEVAASSVRFGGIAELRTWTQPDALVCQVTDHGELGDPLLGGCTPATREEENHGLWLANQISDLVQIRSTSQGSTARVFAWL